MTLEQKRELQRISGTLEATLTDLEEVLQTIEDLMND